MRTSAAGLALIRQSEGFCSTVYQDAAGLSTIGFGHRLAFGDGIHGQITEPQAEALLNQDVFKAEQAVARLVSVPLTQGQFDALVDFVFNLGPERLAASTLLRLLNEGRYEEAARQLLAWDHCGTVVIAGLEKRRQAEFQLWSTNTAVCVAT